jgi:hypothetical protein
LILSDINTIYTCYIKISFLFVRNSISIFILMYSFPYRMFNNMNKSCITRNPSNTCYIFCISSIRTRFI